jgi:hypothetical protein
VKKGRRTLRSYIFTDREREILKAWIEERDRLEGFNRLRFNTRRDIITLIEDVELMFSAVAVDFPDVDFATIRCREIKEKAKEWQKRGYEYKIPRT